MGSEKFNEEKLRTSVFFVEATSFEQRALWKEFRTEGYGNDCWEQDGSGFTQIIGYVGCSEKMPVNVAFSFAILFGSRICFFETISRYCDKESVRAYIRENYSGKITDPDNFNPTLLKK